MIYSNLFSSDTTSEDHPLLRSKRKAFLAQAAKELWNMYKNLNLLDKFVLSLSDFGYLQTILLRWLPSFNRKEFRLILNDMEASRKRIGTGEFARYVALINRTWAGELEVEESVNAEIKFFLDRNVPIDSHVRMEIMTNLSKPNSPSILHSWKSDLPYDAISLHGLILHSLENGDIQEANTTLLKFLQTHSRPLLRSFNAILCAHGNKPQTPETTQQCTNLYNTMITNGVKPNSYTFSYLFKVFKASCDPDACDILLDQMRFLGLTPSAVHYTLAISSTSSSQLDPSIHKRALQLLQTALHDDEAASKDSLLCASTIKAMSGPKSTVMGNIPAVLTAFKKSGAGITKAVVGAVVTAWVSHGNTPRAVTELCRMTEKSWDTFMTADVNPSPGLVDSQTLAILADGFTKEGDMLSAKAVFQMAQRFGLRMSKQLLTALISGFCKFDDSDTAITVFQMIENPDIISFNSLLGGLVSLGKFELALLMLREMAVQPDSITYGIIIDAFVRKDLLEEAVSVYNSMKDMDGKFIVEPSEHIFATLIVALGHSLSISKKKKVKALKSLDIKGRTATLESIFKEYRNLAKLHEISKRPIHIYDAVSKYYIEDQKIRLAIGNTIQALKDGVHIDLRFLVRMARGIARIRGWCFMWIWCTKMQDFLQQLKKSYSEDNIKTNQTNFEIRLLHINSEGKLVKPSDILKKGNQLSIDDLSAIHADVLMSTIASFARFGIFHRKFLKLQPETKEALVKSYEALDVLKYNREEKRFVDSSVLLDRDKTSSWFRAVVKCWIKMSNFEQLSSLTNVEDETGSGSDFLDEENCFEDFVLANGEKENNLEWKRFITKFMQLEINDNLEEYENIISGSKVDSEMKSIPERFILDQKRDVDFLHFICIFLQYCTLRQFWSTKKDAEIFIFETFGIILKNSIV
ncbi:hypothetical protein HK096_000054 [Nowakowskiella sp. JEL0078]|nr:hypothetical protein HK096_000054 [Nowakowskiella sp. JEL0078]